MKEPSVTRATAPRPVTITKAADYKGKVDFAILTIREDEFQAVLDRFPPFTRAEGGRIYNLHRLDLSGGGSYLVAIFKCIEQGNTEALNAARDVLEELEPRWLLLVGIAGGVPSDELTLGDVVVSNRIVDFSVEAVLQDKPAEYALGGGPIHKDAATILANLQALKPELRGWSSAAAIGAPRPSVEIDDGEFYGDEAWQKKARAGLARQAARTEPIVTAGAVGSSDRLVKDTKILATFLLRAARQVLAVEMEAAGVYRATGGGVPLVAIRGLSDIVGFKRDPAWTAYACHTAASFTHAFLKSRPIELKDRGTRGRVATSLLIPASIAAILWLLFGRGEVQDPAMVRAAHSAASGPASAPALQVDLAAGSASAAQPSSAATSSPSGSHRRGHGVPAPTAAPGSDFAPGPAPAPNKAESARAYRWKVTAQNVPRSGILGTCVSTNSQVMICDEKSMGNEVVVSGAEINSQHVEIKGTAPLQGTAFDVSADDPSKATLRGAAGCGHDTSAGASIPNAIVYACVKE